MATRRTIMHIFNCISTEGVVSLQGGGHLVTTILMSSRIVKCTFIYHHGKLMCRIHVYSLINTISTITPCILEMDIQRWCEKLRLHFLQDILFYCNSTGCPRKMHSTCSSKTCSHVAISKKIPVNEDLFPTNSQFSRPYFTKYSDNTRHRLM